MLSCADGGIVTRQTQSSYHHYDSIYLPSRKIKIFEYLKKRQAIQTAKSSSTKYLTESVPAVQVLSNLQPESDKVQSRQPFGAGLAYPRDQVCVCVCVSGLTVVLRLLYFGGAGHAPSTPHY